MQYNIILYYMAFTRCIQNNNILTSDEHINKLKDKTLFLNAKNSKSNNIVNINLKSSSQLNKIYTLNSYKTRYSIAKGYNYFNHDCSINLTNDCSNNNYSYTYDVSGIKGKMNEANYILGSFSSIHKIIHSETGQAKIADISASIYGPDISNNQINNSLSKSDPYSPPWGHGQFTTFTKWDASGVMIDPNNIYINRVSCKPLIYLTNPSHNNYYDLSNNSGSDYEFKQMLKNNNRLNNFTLSSKYITFNK